MSQPRKVLIVIGHPDGQSYCRAIGDAYAAGLPAGCETELLALGDLEFDPVLRYGYRQHMKDDPVIERSQELVRWAEHIVFVFPVWWTAVPSLLKGWFERVFTPRFAYNMDNSSLFTLAFRTRRHLKGRTATVIATYHGPPWYYPLIGCSPVRVVRRQMLGNCGIKTTQVLRLGWLDSPKKDSQARREAFLAKVTTTAGALAKQ
ncbi:MAG: NAD(P)H-dependent oxidoreductase [Bifidobacteriaceae bacterium]|jgi:putative NADPH-quinone reductase|nr:NAD(P)H-dependent oxidoreductase [Bifidobacteriaceae bacterium]